MPSPILNLKFKGNKSFVAFSNLADSDSLTKTWKVCSKVASYLEQGQRLENLSWRLWHLQNLMVESDNARSKREFKKLSKSMSDKLDKEKGRSIEELEAPGYKRNCSTDKIRLRAEEKERNREASQCGRPGVIKRMQFTFSVDKPSPVSPTLPVKKPDLKPSQQFKDNTLRRSRPATRSTTQGDAAMLEANDKDPPSLTQMGRKPSPQPTNNNDMNVCDDDSGAAPTATSNSYDHTISLRFPSIFSNDFGPSALLYAPPTLSHPPSYGEGAHSHGNSREGFSVCRPTIELPLDELLNDANMSDSPGSWSSSLACVDNASPYGAAQDDADTKPISDLNANTAGSVSPSYPPISRSAKEILPTTIHPSQVASKPSKPSLTVKTGTSPNARSAGGPSATATSSMNPAALHSNNSAPGGVKAECSNCGATHTPLWRRGLNDELNCNACGLYCKLHKRPRPKSMRNNHGEGRSQAAPRQDSVDAMGEPAQCYNCHTMATPLWRKDDEGKTVCNACGLYFKLHGSARPISMKSDVIRKRSRHDARRVGTGDPPTLQQPQQASPTLAPDSSTQSAFNYSEEFDFSTSPQSDLISGLGSDVNNSNVFQRQYESTISFSSFPGPYHPDYLQNLASNAGSDPFPFTGDSSEVIGDGDGEMPDRVNKRRRMSQDSASEPPSSTTSYSSFADQQSSATSSQRSSLEFPFSGFGSYNGPNMRGSQNTFWHPPMLPQEKSPQTFIHPPMLPSSDESPMDFLHPPMLPQEDADQLFATFLHPPMVHPEDSPMTTMSSLHPHPPMFPNENSFSQQSQRGQSDYYDSNMSTFDQNFNSGN